MLPSYPYGHDFGNSETGGVLFDRGMQRSITLPSATALGSSHDLLQKRSAMSDSYTGAADALKQGEYILEHEGNELFLGDLALKQSKSATTARGDISRYWSSRSLHLLLTASGTIIREPEYHLCVVTGLPVETFGTADIRRKVRAALEGEHRFTLNGRTRLAVLKLMRVVIEGARALIAYGTSDEITQGCIDIGGRTTDLFVAEGQSPALHLCKGKDIGVEAVTDVLSNRFQACYHRPLKPGETRDLLRAHVNHRTYRPIYVNGKQINEFELQHWLETALSTIGNEIASFVSTTWNTSESGEVGSDIAHIVLVGGGAYYFGETLARRIPHVSIPQAPELANAIGCAALAEQLQHQARTSVA